MAAIRAAGRVLPALLSCTSHTARRCWLLSAHAGSPWPAAARTEALWSDRPRTLATSTVVDPECYHPDSIRNFSIIAHIDHGKSTLADRLLELTGTISTSGKNKQVLDKLQVERERGITVKAQTASMRHKMGGREYLLNLIDTPGHVDFAHEVRTSLRACQGTVLVVDATQGVQAQTLANFYLAFGMNIPVIPVLNKTDLDTADVQGCLEELERLFDIEPESVLCVSAKTGLGVPALLDMLVERVPAPPGRREGEPTALLFDAWYDEYRGVTAMVQMANGSLRKGDKVVSSATGVDYVVQEVGLMYPGETPCSGLYAGQVGYFQCGMKKRQVRGCVCAGNRSTVSR